MADIVIRRVVVYGLLLLSAVVSRPMTVAAQREQVSIIDDFESGALTDWMVQTSGRRGWFIYSDGKTAPDPSRSDALFPFDVPNPPQGRFAAVTDMRGPGSGILYKDAKLDGRYILHLTVFYVSAAALSNPETTDRTSGPNQQYRIDIVDPAAPIDSMAKGDVLHTIFQTAPEAPNRIDPQEIAFDLSQWQGQTVRLRFLTVDNRGPLRAGVDNIRLEPVGR